MLLEIDKAEYNYRQGFHLHPISFEVEPGTFMVLLGPNGSGKSTLFSLINGTRKPAAGFVHINGREISSYPGKQRAKMMGMVPQTSSINFDYTVGELVSMGRYPYQGFLPYESGEDKKIIDRILGRLDLEVYRDRSIRSLSGGEYQRVLLARVLVQQTEILLLDEPGNHLDLKHQTMLLGLLREEVRSGKTVVAVLHDLNQALHYADQGVLLDGGRCIALGKPCEILTPDMIKQVFEVTLKEYRSDDGSVIFGLGGEDT
ncbi:MAG: ABC transporter ATP-binding protein [Spirochaetales bacterium]|nr:ABC transporter ATP-binding protein [Spirochaetales bacterium]